jgi:hypothetical protein
VTCSPKCANDRQVRRQRERKARDPAYAAKMKAIYRAWHQKHK